MYTGVAEQRLNQLIKLKRIIYKCFRHLNEKQKQTIYLDDGKI